MYYFFKLTHNKNLHIKWQENTYSNFIFNRADISRNKHSFPYEAVGECHRHQHDEELLIHNLYTRTFIYIYSMANVNKWLPTLSGPAVANLSHATFEKCIANAVTWWGVFVFIVWENVIFLLTNLFPHGRVAKKCNNDKPHPFAAERPCWCTCIFGNILNFLLYAAYQSM